MALPSPRRVEDTSNPSEPIIEDFTDLCDFCVWFTQKLLEIDDKDIQLREERSFTVELDITPGMCQLCKIISKDPCDTDSSVMTHVIRDWDMGRPRRSEGLLYTQIFRTSWNGRSGSSSSNRICATDIGGYKFAMWANPGKKLGIQGIWMVLRM